MPNLSYKNLGQVRIDFLFCCREKEIHKAYQWRQGNAVLHVASLWKGKGFTCAMS